MRRRNHARSADVLRAVARTLKAARSHPGGGSVVAPSTVVLAIWAEKLEEIAAGAGAGAPRKEMLHALWAEQYWRHRLREPANIAGAVREAQRFTEAIFPWEPTPTRATIERTARVYRLQVFRDFKNRRNIDPGPLLAYLKKHNRRGKE